MPYQKNTGVERLTADDSDAEGGDNPSDDDDSSNDEDGDDVPPTGSRVKSDDGEATSGPPSPMGRGHRKRMPTSHYVP